MGILALVYQLKDLTQKLPDYVPISLWFLSYLIAGAAFPIVYLELRSDERFNPSETLFFYGILTCFHRCALQTVRFYILENL